MRLLKVVSGRQESGQWRLCQRLLGRECPFCHFLQVLTLNLGRGMLSKQQYYHRRCRESCEIPEYCIVYPDSSMLDTCSG